MIPTLLLVLLTLTSSAEVDYLNILLPELQEPIPTFPLQLITAQDGCYHWKSSQPDFIHISPHNPKSPGCSRQALVSVNKIGPFTSSIFVSADEANSQSEMKIPVRIRKVKKIRIASKSRMMNIKEVQRLELFAFDNDENTFTSLEGLRFKWRLVQDTKILESVPIINAKLFLPLRTRENIEKSGYQSDMIVVKALAPGNLKVVATCIEPGYENLTDEIIISVHERFELKPGPIIRMAPETSLQLALFRPSGQEIPLPQPYYNIISCDEFSLNSTFYLTVSDRQSRCVIKVQDTRTKPPYKSIVQVIVDYADEIRIITSPLVIVGKQSSYQVQLLRQGVGLFGQSKKIEVRSDFQLDNAKKTLVASRKMTGTVSAQLGNLKKEITINSFLPVTVILPNKYLHLPVGQFFKLRALGGTGLFDFQINHEIATISSIHVLHAKSVGDTIVTVRDRNHLVNNVTFRLKVSDLSEIHSLEAEKEVNRDEWGKFYVIGRSSAHQTFTQCYSASFSIMVPSANLDLDKKVNHQEELRFLQYTQSPLVQEVLSATSLLKGKHQQLINNYEQYVLYDEIESNDLKNYVINLENYGICKIAKFKSIVTFDEYAMISLDGQDGVMTRVPLRVYNHIITTIEGQNHEFLLTPESSIKWSYTGGSYFWKNSHKNVQLNQKILQQNTIPVIYCPSQEVSPQVYQLKVYNQQTRRLLFPTQQKANVTIICKFPKKLHLQLQHGEALDQLFIEKNRQITGDVQVSDEFNQIFYNASNVVYEFSPISGIINSREQSFVYKDNGINDTITFFTEQLSSGLRFKRVSSLISVYLIPPIEVEHPLSPKDESKNITIYALFTPKKPYIIKVYDLHSHVQVQCTRAVSCERGQDYIAVNFLKLGVGYVTIRDKKMYGSESWNFQFVIVETDDVKILGDRDYVQEGDDIKLTVLNYHNGQLISPHTYEPSYMQLILPRNLRIIEHNVNQFIVRAEQAGQYDIFAENTYPRVTRSKDPFNVNVYKQIQPNIEPVTTTADAGFLMIEAKVAVLVDCRRIVRIRGGPKEMKLTYHSESSSIKLIPQGRRSVQITSAYEGTYQVVITADYKGNKIAIIMVTATISKIQSIELQSIEEPVVDSHFRIHPKFKINNEDLSDLTCDFHYHWSTNNGNIRLGESRSFGYVDAAGINATAIRQGSQVINLQVISKDSENVLGKVSKYIEVLQDVNILFPAYINKAPCCPPTSILMPPSTRYTFDQVWSVSTENSLVNVAEQRNIIDSGKKIGHTTATVTRNGYRPLFTHIEVKHINGVFIGNHEGFISIQPYDSLIIPIYLQDNNGRLFASPLQYLDVLAYSSNSQILQVELSPNKNELVVASKEQGVCVISVILPGRNLIDSIVVSIGSALSPGRYVKVLKGGSVQFNSVSVKEKWVSSHPEIAQIDEEKGISRALRVGKSTISHGQLQSTLQVLEISKIQQIRPQEYKGSSLIISYQLFWQNKNGLEELPSSTEEINHNFHPECAASSRYLISKSQMFTQNGRQRLLCTISAQDGSKIPESVSVTIKDSNGNTISKFDYTVKPLFALEKYLYTLSPSNPKALITIKTGVMIKVIHRNGKAGWIESTFIEKNGHQTVKIDMSGQQTDTTWWLQLSCEGQREEVTFIYNTKGKQDKEKHSFWSFSMDWPDYLILIMAMVFGTICYVQYNSDQKRKSS